LCLRTTVDANSNNCCMFVPSLALVVRNSAPNSCASAWRENGESVYFAFDTHMNEREPTNEQFKRRNRVNEKQENKPTLRCLGQLLVSPVFNSPNPPIPRIREENERRESDTCVFVCLLCTVLLPTIMMRHESGQYRFTCSTQSRKWANVSGWETSYTCKQREECNIWEEWMLHECRCVCVCVCV
jgi:hypothetical protein